MEPDGSLCRITSSYKDLVNNVRIVRDPDSDPCIKLVLLKLDDDSDESEKSSEITDGETDDELSNVKIPEKSADKDSGTDTKIENSNESIKDKRIGREWGRNYRSKTFFRRNYRRGRGNNFHKTNRSENVSNLKRNYNYGKRDFNHPVTYNKPNQHSSDEILPWLDQSAMHKFQCQTYTVPSHPENLRNSVGLLGDRPLYMPHSNDQSLVYSPISTNFQPSSSNKNPNSPYSSMTPNFASNRNNFRRENPSASYSQMSSHYPSNNLTNDQNYWSNNYRSHNKNHRGMNRGRNGNKRKNWDKNRRPNDRNN